MDVVLYGAGIIGRQAYNFLSVFNDKVNIVAFCDRNYEKIKEVFGIKVLSFGDAKNKDCWFIISNEKDREEIHDMLIQEGVRFSDDFFSFFKQFIEPQIIESEGLPNQYYQMYIEKHRKQEYLEKWMKDIEKDRDIRVVCNWYVGTFKDIGLNVIIKLNDCINSIITLDLKQLCQGGHISIYDYKSNTLIKEDMFENRKCKIVLNCTEEEMLLKVHIDSIDIPHMTVTKEHDQFRNRCEHTLNHQIYSNYLNIRKQSRMVLHEEDYFLLRHFRDKKGIILDCGVNYCQSTISFRKVLPYSKIIGYEANPELWDFLRNMEIEDDMVEFFYCGLADVRGDIPFYYCGDDLMTSGSFDQNNLITRMMHYGINKQNLSIVNVPVKTIDETISDTKDVWFIKMDLEGFEYQALLGAQDLIARCRPLLLIEDDLNMHDKMDVLLHGYKRYYYDYRKDGLIEENECSSINCYMVPMEILDYTKYII